MEQGTDFHPGTYTLAVTPNIKLAGKVTGRALESAFNSGLIFRYDRVQFYLVRDETGQPIGIDRNGSPAGREKEPNNAFPGRKFHSNARWSLSAV
jgi:hypothetical protein